MTAVQHIAFGCSDRLISEKFYAKHFGFKRVRTFSRGQPDEFVLLRRGSTCIELFPAAVGSPPAKEQAVGFRHLAFEVDDLDSAIAGLKADGVKTDAIIDCGGIVPGMRVCFFKDPDGNTLELMQGYRDEV
jgi:glyoxylase I family protein